MLKIFLNIILGMILGKLKDFALKTVSKLNAETITNEEKRKLAFQQIKDEAIAAGKDLRDSLINLSLEAAVSLIKFEKTIKF